jgi:transcriptional regulator with XRE-family HTH domain
MTHLNYLSLHRKRWALSQRELAGLLGHASRSVVSRLELGGGRPSLRFALACQTIFGLGVAELFPDLFEQHQDDVMRRAAVFDGRLRDKADASSARKRELLADMVGRALSRDEA